MFSKFIRRTHMYLALGLMPWMLMYALSTIAMNHRSFFREHYGGNLVAWELENQQTYPRSFHPDTDPEQIAKQILRDLRLDGAHAVRKAEDAVSLTIVRHDLAIPRRISYHPADRKLLIEKQVFRTPAFLERMHRRRGYQTDYRGDDAWALSLDLVIAAMVFWVFSGLWMWWELKTTRGWGAFAAIGGVVLYAFFILAL